MFVPPCPLNFKIWSLHASSILRFFHILWGAAVLQNGKFRFALIIFRLYREVLLQQSGCQKVPQNGNRFPFLRVCDVFFIFCFCLFLDWTWFSKLWKLMASQTTTVQKRILYKTKGPGPACIDMTSKQLRFHYKIRDQVPILRVHMFQ